MHNSKLGSDDGHYPGARAGEDSRVDRTGSMMDGLVSKVSIIIPCYRQAYYLPTAIDSALNQTYPNVEVIVINDGSDDDTEAVAARYGNRLRYVYQDNGGLSSARNAGIAQATGDFIMFLDSDDELHEDALAVLMQGQSAHSDSAVVMGYRNFTGELTREWLEPIYPPTVDIPFPKMLFGNLMPVHCWLVPRCLVDAVGGFSSSLRSLEDWDLWLRLCLKGMNVVTVSFVGAYYRMHAGSMSTNSYVMGETSNMVLLRIIAAVRDSPRLLGELGPTVLEITRERIKSLIATKEYPALVPQLVAASRELQRELGPQKQRWCRKAVDFLFGRHAERCTVLYYRLFEPSIYRAYAGRSQVRGHSGQHDAYGNQKISNR